MPGGWPGYNQPAPGYGQPGPGYGQPAPGYAQQPMNYGPPGAAYGQQQMPAGYPGGQMPPNAYPGQPAGYGAGGVPGQIAGQMPGFGQPQQEAFGFIPPGGMSPAAAAGVVETGGGGFPNIHTETPAQPPAPEPTPPPAADKAAPAEEQAPQNVRIPCPQGHELQTPMDMVGQEVLCPICATQFHLRYEDSIEYKEEQAERRRRRAENVNQAALKWAIGTAVAIVLAIVGMLVYHVARKPSAEENYSLPEEPAPSVTTPAAPAAPDQKQAAPSPAAKSSAEPAETP